ncbi:MAG: hypothetical protein BWX90_00993 [bacterium ADurb.Bin132]|nr:MAG: hypothetical protein BWX90_00993 [bacterium ADurb.Bin132]
MRFLGERPFRYVRMSATLGNMLRLSVDEPTIRAPASINSVAMNVLCDDSSG